MTIARRAVIGASLTILTSLAILMSGVSIASAGQKADASEISSHVDAATLNEAKTTSLGLYLTPKDAHLALTKNPEIIFIDVRDPIEAAFAGHADSVDKVIPLSIATHEVNPKTGQYRMAGNTNFLADVDAFVAAEGKSKDDPIFVSCRSGGRSAAAAQKLIDAGYTNVWNLVEGFEGDNAPDGTRTLNGWRNADLPWGYKFAPGVAWQN
ncbi:MAG: rhodanese-like domain-containing protein [Pseudomonadota bacterium]